MAIERARQIKLMPVCAPAETPEELRYQINFLLDEHERELIKLQMEAQRDADLEGKFNDQVP